MNSTRVAAAVLPLFLSACFASAPPAASAARFSVVEGRVSGTGDRTCTTYLVTSDAAVHDAPLVLSLWGTGEYTMSGSWDGDPSAEPAIAAGAAWLVIDKPGVVADASAPRGYRTDDAVYNKYTLADLTACATAALRWASERPQVGEASPIVVRGHSEGAIVAGEVLLALHESKDVLASRVEALLLSGVPAGSMREIFERQAEASGRSADYERALQNGDDAFVRAHTGLGAETLRALLAARPLRETFAALAPHRPATRIALFHGTEDANAPVEMVRALVEDNEARLSFGEPALELAARYYGAGHRLDLGAVHDMNLWMLDAIRGQGYLGKAEREAGQVVAIEAAESAIAAAVGQYRIEEGVTLAIKRDGKHLFAQVTGQQAFPIYFTAENKLATRVAPIELELERDGAGVQAVVLIQGERLRCPRVE